MSANAPEELDYDQYSKKTVYLTLFAILSCQLIASIDGTAVAIALSSISNDLHSSSVKAYWFGTSFVLCSATFAPVFASFSNALGRKPLILAALVIFAAGSVICGIAQRGAVLIAGRCLQGMGEGGIKAMTFVILADMLPLHRRSRFAILDSVVRLVGTLAGPFIGGACAQTIGWRYIFYLTLPFCMLSIVLIATCMKIHYTPPHSPRERFGKIDWAGCFSFIVFMTSLLIPLSWGGVMFSWRSNAVTVPLVSGTLGICGWGVYTWFIPENPFIPLSILNNWSAMVGYFGVFIHGIVYYAVLFYLPVYYQAAKSYSPIKAGAALLPEIFMAALTNGLTGWLIGRTRNVKYFVIVGWAMIVFGLGLLQLLGPSSTVVEWVFINIPPGIGTGVVFGASTLFTQAIAEQPSRNPSTVAKIKAMAAALNQFFRGLGQALGIVIGQAIFTNEMKMKTDKATAKQASSIAEKIAKGELEGKVGLVMAFVRSLRVMWWVLFGISVLVLVLSCMVKNVRVSDGKEMVDGSGMDGELGKVVEENGLAQVADKREKGRVEVTAEQMRRYSKGPNAVGIAL